VSKITIQEKIDALKNATIPDSVTPTEIANAFEDVKNTMPEIDGDGKILSQYLDAPELEDNTVDAFSIEDEVGNKAMSISLDGKTDFKDFSEATKNKIIAFVGQPTTQNPTVTAEQTGSLDNYADVNHIITYGQSLSVGQTEVVISSTSIYPDNLINFDGVTRTSNYDKSLTGDAYPTNRRIAFAPLIERVNDGTSATGTLRETPTTGTVESLALEINKFSNKKFPDLPMKILGSAPGYGAKTALQLSKGTTYYAALISDVTAGKNLSNASGKIYKVLAVTWTQGESDYVSGTTSTDYKAQMIQLKNDLNTDIKAITGQIDDVAIIMYQVATSNGGSKTYPNIALTQYDLAMTEPGFYMATAMYQFKYNDNFHLKSQSSKLLGAYYGLAINKIVSENIDLKPLHPKSHIVQGNLIKLKFEVPAPPLRFQAANTVTLPNKGFAVIKAAVNILTSVEIGYDGTSVNLICSESPAGALIQYGINVTLTPNAGPNGKVNMVNLSDSQGELQTFTIEGEVLKMDNWSPIFEYQA
jgi:hypothetical protein